MMNGSATSAAIQETINGLPRHPLTGLIEESAEGITGLLRVSCLYRGLPQGDKEHEIPREVH